MFDDREPQPLEKAGSRLLTIAISIVRSFYFSLAHELKFLDPGFLPKSRLYLADTVPPLRVYACKYG